MDRIPLQRFQPRARFLEFLVLVASSGPEKEGDITGLSFFEGGLRIDAIFKASFAFSSAHGSTVRQLSLAFAATLGRQQRWLLGVLPPLVAWTQWASCILP